MECRFLRSPGRLAEFEAIVHPGTRDRIRRLGWSFTKYSGLHLTDHSEPKAPAVA